MQSCGRPLCHGRSSRREFRGGASGTAQPRRPTRCCYRPVLRTTAVPAGDELGTQPVSAFRACHQDYGITIWYIMFQYILKLLVIRTSRRHGTHDRPNLATSFTVAWTRPSVTVLGREAQAECTAGGTSAGAAAGPHRRGALHPAWRRHVRDGRGCGARARRHRLAGRVGVGVG